MLDVPSTRPRLWLIMGTREGDNNQLLALAEAIGYPFEVKPLAYNQMRRFSFLRRGLTIVAAASRELLRPPWPDMVIGVGYGSVPVARYIRRQNRGRTKIVHIGNPRGSAKDFDLLITTPQYSRGTQPRLIEVLFPIGNPAKAIDPTEEELEWVSAMPRPRRLIAIGGAARHWQLDHEALADAARILGARTPTGSIIVATSPRTDRDTRQLFERLLTGENQVLVEHFPRFGTLLRECDEIYVTADSVSMISEAILSGKPTGVIPIKRSLRGLLALWLLERLFKRASFPNLPNFWRRLDEAGLAGTVELPVASQVCDTVDRAANAVRVLLGAGEALDEENAVLSASHLGHDWRSRWRQRSGRRPRRSDRPAVRNQATRI